MTRAGSDVTARTCYCGRDIQTAHGRWRHSDDGSMRCYPDEPRDAEMVAEPDPYVTKVAIDKHPDWCKCSRLCGGDQ
jgi:hypothetical protein